MKTNYVQDLQAALLHISRVMLGPPLSDHECAELAQFAQRVVYGDAHAPKEDYERLSKMEEQGVGPRFFA